MTIEQINQTISKIQVVYPPQKVLEFLQLKFQPSEFFFIDVWSFVHLLSGGILRFIAPKWYIALSALILFEILEWGIFVQLTLAQPEGILNILWDIGVGFLGWAIFNKFYKKKGIFD